MKTLALSLLATCVLASIAIAAQAEMEVRELAGEPVWSIRDRSAAVDRVLAELAERTGRRVEGLERIDPVLLREPVAIELADRAFSDVVQVLAGSIGARARISVEAIELSPDLGLDAPLEDLDAQTSRAWMHFLKSNATHALAAEGEMALAEQLEREEKLAAASTHYLLVLRNHPESELVPKALLAAGLIHGRLGDWNAAAEAMTRLANLERSHPYGATARLELARALAQRGDGRQAIFLLDALERQFPGGEVREREARLYVRARALGQSGRHAEALETLERADAVRPSDEHDPFSLALRAEALEHFDRPAEAARAWLAYAGTQTGSERDRALTAAARSASLAGDGIAVLFIDKLAAGTPAATNVLPLAIEARERLAIAPRGEAALDEQDLARAESLVAARSFARARTILERLSRTSTDEALTTRIALAKARALDAEEGLESALAPLRAALEKVEDVERRRQIYVLAGELYEGHERFDEAIAAYGGSL